MNQQTPLAKHWKYLLITFIFIWPFLYLFRYVIADQSFSLKLKMDVVYFYFCKVYLLDALTNFRIPLWTNAEACGFPFFASPYNQVLYPLNIPLALYYKLVGGFSWIDGQRFSVLGISLFGLNLFAWLQTIKVNWRAAFFTCLIMCTGFALVGVVNRFPATHSAAWIMMIVWGITLAIKKPIKGGLLIGIGSFMLLTIAYAYSIYYSFAFLFPFYILLMLFPKTREAIYPTSTAPRLIPYIVTIGLSFLIPLVLCAPYLYEMFSLKDVVAGRSDFNAVYLAKNGFTFTHHIASWIMPSYSSFKGWYYMGFFPLFIILSYLINYFYPLTKQKANRTFLLIFFGYFFIVALATQGNNFFSRALMNYLPGFAGLKIVSRINVVLLPFLALLLAQSYTFFEGLLKDKSNRLANFQERLPRFVGIFGVCYLLILVGQLLFHFLGTPEEIWTNNMATHFPDFPNYFYIPAGFISLLVFLGITYMLGKKDESTFTFLPKNALLYSLLPLMIVVLNAFSVRMESSKICSANKNPASFRKPLDLNNVNEIFFVSPRTYNVAMSGVKTDQPFSALHHERWYYESYRRFLRKKAGQGNFQTVNKESVPFSVNTLLGVQGGRKLFFAKHIDYKNVKTFLLETAAHEQASGTAINIHKYDGDYVELTISAKQAGTLCFIDNWDKDWSAKMNGEEIPIRRLFGTFKAVDVPVGKHQIQFNYNPFPINLVRSFPDWSNSGELLPGSGLIKPLDLEKIRLSKEKTTDGELVNSEELNQLSQQLVVDQAIRWQDLVKVKRMDGGGIQSRHRKMQWGLSGAYSTTELADSTNGAVEIILTENRNYGAIGFSMENKDASLQTIGHSFFMTPNGSILIYERGDSRGKFGEWAIGDTLRIERIQDRVLYRQNGKLLYISGIKNSGALHVDVAFLHKRSTFDNIKSSFK